MLLRIAAVTMGIGLITMCIPYLMIFNQKDFKLFSPTKIQNIDKVMKIYNIGRAIVVLAVILLMVVIYLNKN